MKKLVLTLALVLLTLTEVYLSTPFFPVRWQQAVDAGFSHILPQGHDYSAITHPALDHEIQQALKHSASFRIAFCSVFALLLVGNTLLWRRTWKVLGEIRR